MIIVKFGGSSLRDGSRIRAITEVILAVPGRKVVVLSAMHGITDLLIDAARQAELSQDIYRRHLREIALRHLTAVGELFGAGVLEKPDGESGPGSAPREARPAAGPEPELFAELAAYSGPGAGTVSKLRGLLTELTEVLTGVELVRECSPRSLDLVMSFGERMSCTLVVDYLSSLGERATYVDARELIRTDASHGGAEVDLAESCSLIARRGLEREGLPVITGFIAASREGATTTLGRNGADYTASIVGAALHAERIEIWTDQDGVMSADPRFVADSFVIPALSYQEAMELAYFGAKVLHPNTMVPAVASGIPILIKNALDPSAPGTLISRSASRGPGGITGIASIEDVALVNVEGGGMIGVRGFASRVFVALARAGVNVIMISQASSEHSICLVVRAGEAEAALRSLKEELGREIAAERLQQPQLLRDLEIIAVIGESMRGTPGISGRLFSALGDEGINVLAIAQGSSERNISLVVERKDKRRALQSIHRAFLGKGAVE